ncbi:MAG: glycosyl hydrolase family 95 catalytic domain-containing protein [Kiritimatiellia bacterium]|jgi:alpha-L-fucosidase 2
MKTTKAASSLPKSNASASSRLVGPDWRFPLERPHLGALLGNADVGAMVWGEGRLLRITLGRPDVWDHSGGSGFSAEQTYSNIRATLESGDADRLKALFPVTETRPTVVPLGRMEFDLGAGARLDTAALDIAAGVLAIGVSKGRRERVVRVVMDVETGALHIAWPDGLKPVAACVPAWDGLRADFDRRGFLPPTRFEAADFGGWVQTLPRDPAVVCAWTTQGGESALVVFRTETVEDDDVFAEAAVALADASARGFARTVRAAAAWWKAYWREAPALDLPNPTLQRLHDYGMYKFACATRPGATPCTLQGPWVEDYQFPPWSNDYHFNINVQMCYWPAYHGNRLEHLRPLFDMILRWLPQLRENARIFIGVEDGVMLPHSVDDRCRCMGNFWTGMMDHGCTMWIAEMMFRHVRYSGDRKFLRTAAYPFMCGAMAVFAAMLETTPDGALALPVGISPEFRGADPDAWGRNPSFQLACAHRLAEDIQAAAELLGETPPPICAEILDKLPKAALEPEGRTSVIALWEGLKLHESHRHHSHLAAIAPFDTIDCESPEWAEIVEASLANWIFHGPGLWSGWCVPWASMLHTRVGNAEMAEMWLEIWERFFTNRGHGTLHDADAAGISLLGMKAVGSRMPPRLEIMQLDGGMGCVAAIHEMLLHDRRGVNHLFRGAPARWDDVGFSGLLASGAVLVSATRRRGRVQTVTLEAKAATTFRLANPFGTDTYRIRRGAAAGVRRSVPEDGVIVVKLKKGERARLG